jgi:hypothetical protein
MSGPSDTSSEYDVVSFKVDLGTASLLLAVYPFLFGVLIDELPFLVPRSWRQYLSYAFYAGLVSAALGIVLGLLALRKPESRGRGQVGIVVNVIVLALEGLYVYAFRWVMGR